QGFRKGHVPAHMLKQYYGQEAESKALQKIADELTPALMRSQKNATALAPDILLESADADLVFKYTFDILPTFDP
ncbi:trigger factor family protein, partial [Brucella intermedia]|uniref:trigger factor family protein n=1 Tax=Brucella intermedia TaxID=94625 RepID=UPI002362AAD8